jgi:hypothetical protein
MPDGRGISALHVVGSICSIVGLAIALNWLSPSENVREAPSQTSAPAPSRTEAAAVTHALTPPQPAAPAPEPEPSTAALPPVPRKAEEAPVAPARVASAPVAAAPVQPRDEALESFLQFVSRSGRPGVAAAIRSQGGSDVGEAILSGLGQRGLPLLNVFHRGFLTSRHFDDLSGGDGRLLRRSGVLSNGSLALVGSTRHSFRRGEFGLITCDLTFSYVVLDSEGRERARRTLRSTVPAYDEGTALHDAIAALLENNARQLDADLRS